MEQEKGFIKRVITFYVHTAVGDKFLDKVNCDFRELKGEEGYVVEEKQPPLKD
jgi:hypothetical protein